MAISRNIASIWITDYDKSIGDVANYLASGSGRDAYMQVNDEWNNITYYRSSVTGVTEISAGGYFWGQSQKHVPNDQTDGRASNLDGTLLVGATTIAVDDATYFSSSGGYIVFDQAWNAGEIVYYGGKSANNLTSCVRGQLYTDAAEHVDGALVYIYERGIVLSINYDEEDEVYAIRVALSSDLLRPGALYSDISKYYVYRFEFPKRVVDLVKYEDVENPTTIP